jgi:hypothetical protein
MFSIDVCNRFWHFILDNAISLFLALLYEAAEMAKKQAICRGHGEF